MDRRAAFLFPRNYICLGRHGIGESHWQFATSRNSGRIRDRDLHELDEIEAQALGIPDEQATAHLIFPPLLFQEHHQLAKLSITHCTPYFDFTEATDVSSSAAFPKILFFRLPA